MDPDHRRRPPHEAVDRTVSPLQWLREDRVRARALQDPYAELCALATVDSRNHPQVRTLVLRDLNDRLGVFVNASSPKWPSMERVGALIYLDSLGVQYRLNCTTDAVPAELVRASWQLRPDTPKRLDWFYEQRTQSSELSDRDQLLEELAAGKIPDPLVAPESARGLYLIPWQIERLDLNSGDGVHDRRRWRLEDGAWRERVLVP